MQNNSYILILFLSFHILKPGTLKLTFTTNDNKTIYYQFASLQTIGTVKNVYIYDLTARCKYY